jgi:hypothetical protein
MDNFQWKQDDLEFFSWYKMLVEPVLHLDDLWVGRNQPWPAAAPRVAAAAQRLRWGDHSHQLATSCREKLFYVSVQLKAWK